jgi:hypothetical protein
MGPEVGIRKLRTEKRMRELEERFKRKDGRT